MELQGCVAFVTGSNRGIGKCFVDALLSEGASRVYAAARTPDKLDQHYGNRVSPVQLDITDASAVKSAAELCTDVNLLINNAGISTYQPALWPSDADAARAEMETNYFGTLAMCQAFAPILGRNGGGALVNIISTAALVGPPFLASYSASKAAAMRMTQGVRAQLRDQGTVVSGVFFGNVDTEMTAIIDGPKSPPDEIVRNTLAGIHNGQEDIYADARAREIIDALKTDPKGIERTAEAVWRAEWRER